MGSIVDAAAPIAGQVLDPLNLTGVNSNHSGPHQPPPVPGGVGSIIGQTGGQFAGGVAPPPPPKEWNPNSMGFLGSMLGGQPGSQFALHSQAMPPPPPSGWAAQPGKGPVWMEPQRTIDRSATNDVDRNWKMTPEASGSPFRGNRI